MNQTYSSHYRQYAIADPATPLVVVSNAEYLQPVQYHHHVFLGVQQQKQVVWWDEALYLRPNRYQCSVSQGCDEMENL